MIGAYRFRFRIWNKKNNEYITGLYLVGGTNMLFETVTHTCEFVTENDVVEQCTGLKDANGDFIFENDVIKSKTGHLYEIRWRESSFVAVHRAQYMPDTILNQDWLNVLKMKTVGNIHELPDDNIADKCKIDDSERSAVADVQRTINQMRRGAIRITTSAIQRELGCSFGYAGAIMAHLETCGIVSAPDKDGVRKLINKGE